MILQGRLDNRCVTVLYNSGTLTCGTTQIEGVEVGMSWKVQAQFELEPCISVPNLGSFGEKEFMLIVLECFVIPYKLREGAIIDQHHFS